MSETLHEGEWFYFRMEYDTLVIPKMVSIYTGSWETRKQVRKVGKHTALALWRWHSDGMGGCWVSVKDGNGNWFDIRVAGDVAAFYGDE